MFNKNKMHHLRHMFLSMLVMPLPAFARGHFDVVGMLYVLGGIGAVFLLYYVWMFLFGMLIFPFTFALMFDKKLDENLATFAICGFFITFLMPITVIDKNFFELHWYGNILVSVIWMFLWYCLVKFIQYKVESKKDIDEIN